MIRLFRCYDKRNSFWLFEDLDILSNEFIDYLTTIQMTGREFYALSQWSGIANSRGVRIYEDDFIQYKQSIYRVYYDAPQFLFECLVGECEEFIDPSQCEVIGNAFEANYLNLLGEEIEPIMVQ